MAAVNERQASQGLYSYQAQIAEAQHAIDAAIDQAGLRRDAYGHALGAMKLVIGTFPGLVQHLEATRQPIRDEDMRVAVAQGMAGHAWRFVRALSIRTIVLAAGMLVAALLIGGAMGWWLHGPPAVLVGLRAGPEKCDDRPDGSRMCWIPIFERMPPKPR